ncbi:MAG: hypothetical protein ACOYB8_10455 [Eubacteriaceae bacterium]|jgi:hypothetical protein
MAKKTTAAVKDKGKSKGLVLYLLLTLLMLMLMGSFVSDNVYTSASKVTTDQAGISYTYRAAIGDGLYSSLTSTTGVQ